MAYSYEDEEDNPVSYFVDEGNSNERRPLRENKMNEIKNILSAYGVESAFYEVISKLEEQEEYGLINIVNTPILNILKEIQHFQLEYRDDGEGQEFYETAIKRAIRDLEAGQTGKKRRNKCRRSKVGKHYLLRDKKGRFAQNVRKIENNQLFIIIIIKLFKFIFQ